MLFHDLRLRKLVTGDEGMEVLVVEAEGDFEPSLPLSWGLVDEKDDLAPRYEVECLGFSWNDGIGGMARSRRESGLDE
jgi:hypothetical protein